MAELTGTNRYTCTPTVMQPWKFTYLVNHSLWNFSIFKPQIAHDLFLATNTQTMPQKNLQPDISNIHFVKEFHEYLIERDDIITIIKLLGIFAKRTARRKVFS